MTLQVGFVGSDGLVIASDRLLQQWQFDALGSTSGYSLTLSSKFVARGGFLCYWCGDKVSELAASNICDLPWQNAKEDVREALKIAGNKAWKQIYADGTNGSGYADARKVIVVCPDYSMFIVDVSPCSFANVVLNKVVAGDIKNTARHFINNYVPDEIAPINLPIGQLIFPAAHAILIGGKENPTGVGGLEVVVLPNDGPMIVLTPEEEQQLKALSERLDETIRERLLQTFNYSRPALAT